MLFIPMHRVCMTPITTLAGGIPMRVDMVDAAFSTRLPMNLGRHHVLPPDITIVLR
jgi:hypothetical protein